MGLQPTFRRSLFLLLLGITLSFGWWPFSFFAENDVDWLREEGALRFNRSHERGDDAARGVAYSSEILDTRGWSGVSVAIELKGRPRGNGLGVFLEFFEEGEDVAPALLLAQWQQHLAARSRRPEDEAKRGYQELGYRDCFGDGEYRRLFLSSRGERTHVYVDGMRVEARSNFSLLGPDNAFVGRIALGNSADGTRPFTGEIRRVAVYPGFFREGSSELARARPALDYAFGEEGVGETDGLAALARREGLDVPSPLRLKERRFFNSIGEGNWEKAGYRSDVLVNSLGFIPIGLCFAAMARRRTDRFVGVLLLVAGASFALSATIEWGQAYLAHRDSSQLDLLLNTLSGAVAVFVPKRLTLFL